MGKKGNRQYTLEFKQQAADLANDIGITRAAERLGINVGNVQRWKAKMTTEGPTPKKTKEDLEAENHRLNKENEELKKVNYILKRAAAFFSQDHLK